MLTVACTATVRCADWPMWRFDATRSACAPVAPSGVLAKAWVLQLPSLEPAWEDEVNRDRMPFDRCYEPIVVGHTLIFGSSRDDLVRGIDTRTGSERWRFRCNAPVRLPPAAAGNRAFVASDDGCLYVLDTDTGELLRSHRAGPDARKVLGNRRLVSAWPARGGPVVHDGVVYYAAGIWPFMGVFVYALDADSGSLRWENSTLGARYMNQPHGGAEGFGGLAPQGALAVTDGTLLVPGGRSVPAALDASDGALRYYHLAGTRMVEAGHAMNRKLEGGSHIAATKGFFLNHRGLATTLYDAKTGDAYLHFAGTVYPVLDGTKLYLSGKNIQACDLNDLTRIATEKTVTDRKTGERKTVTTYHWELKPRWTCQADASDALIKAGDRLYAAAKGRITAVQIQETGGTVVWEKDVDGTVARLICGDNRLFAVTLEGNVVAFAPDTGAPVVRPERTPRKPVSHAAQDTLAADLVSRLSVARGYCLISGMRTPQRAEAILAASNLDVVAITPDEDAVRKLRRHFDDLGLYGTRISIQQGTPERFRAPPYLAVLTIAEDVPADADALPSWLNALRNSVRPYGGILCVAADSGAATESKARLRRMVERTADAQWRHETIAGRECLVRYGALPGAADWTHLYGDIANSAKSDDQLVRAPLGLLWFGMTGHRDVLPRHAHGPSEQVVGGRLFIEGINVLSARDIYTGMVLWRREFEDLGTFGIYYDASYRDDPLDTSYNQAHIAGANARGTNYVVTDDAVYLAVGPDCLMLDPATGKTLGNISLPDNDDGKRQWGFIGVCENMLIGGNGFVRVSQKYGLSPKNWTEKTDTSASAGLAVFDRHSGKLLWKRPAKLGFLHNAIVAGNGRIYCIDRLPASAESQLRRRGNEPSVPARLTVLDLHTGTVVWENEQHAFGTWLAYSDSRNAILQCGRHSRDMTAAEPKDRMMLINADDGSVVWDRQTPHGGPAMLFDDTVVLPAVGSTGTAIDMRTGEQRLRENPLTGQKTPWTYHRTYGCNSVVASEHMLTFRSGTAAFYDLQGDCGTANLGGFKSGCTSNLIAAGGILNAPDYTRTCTCAYQNQTSLALIHMPDVEHWTAMDAPIGNAPLQELGLNLGAPGDRRDADGLVWFDFPSVGGPSPQLPVETTPSTPRTVAVHSSGVDGTTPWIGASALEGLRSITVQCVPGTQSDGGVVIPVQTGNDDAEEAQNGAVTTTSSDLEMVTEASDQIVGLTFRNIPLEHPDDLDSAYIQFAVDEPTDVPTDLIIQCEADATPTPFTTRKHNLSSRRRTIARVTWTPPPWPKAGDAGAAQRTPDLAPLLREVLARADWERNSSLVVLISGSGKRVAQSFNRSADAAARLVIIPSHPPASSAPAARYHVQLVFADLTAEPGQRRFDVRIQGTEVLKALDIAAEAGTATTLIKSFPHVSVTGALHVELIPVGDSTYPPLLSGLSLRREP